MPIVNGNGGSSSFIASTPVVLTDAQIKSLPTITTPVLVAAPGANKVLLPVTVVFVANFAANYTGIDADGSYFGVYWSDGISAPAQWGDLIQNATGGFTTHLTDLSGLLAPFSPTAILQLPVAYQARVDSGGVASVNAFTQNLALIKNTPLVLLCGNTLDFTGGDPANTLTITVYYVVIDV